MLEYIIFFSALLIFFLTLLAYWPAKETQREKNTEKDELIQQLEQERDELIQKAREIMKDHGSESAELFAKANEISEQIKRLKK